MRPDLIRFSQEIPDIFLDRRGRLFGQSGLEFALGAVVITAAEQRHRVVIVKGDIIRLLSRQP